MTQSQANPSTIWATLAGVLGASGGVLYINAQGIAPTIDPANLYFDETNSRLNIGFDFVSSYTYYNAAGPAGLAVRHLIDSYLENSSQAAGDVAGFAITSSRGSAQIPQYNLNNDLIGSIIARSWSTAAAVGSVAAWNTFFDLSVYTTGGTASNLGSTMIMQIKLDNGSLTPVFSIDHNQLITFLGDMTITGDLVVGGTLTIPGLVINTGNIADGAVTANKESDDPWTDVASAATVDIGAIDKRNINITGVVSITSFGSTGNAGRRRTIKTAGQLIITYNAVTLLTPGSRNIYTQPGDTFEAIYLGGGAWMLFNPSPASGFDVNYSIIPQVSKNMDYTATIYDAGSCIFHPASDLNSRTFTIPSNAAVPYPIGTVLEFINRSPNNISIAITADTLTLGQGSATAAGSTGTRTLAQYGLATAQKIGATEWLITGVGLT